MSLKIIKIYFFNLTFSSIFLITENFKIIHVSNKPLKMFTATDKPKFSQYLKADNDKKFN